MSEAAIPPELRPEAPGPNELRDPFVRQELKRAGVWIGLAVAVALVAVLSQPLLIIFGGVVFAAMLDGGTRLLGRVVKIGRGWRLLIVVLGVVAFLVWVVMLAGSELTDQAEALTAVVKTQTDRLMAWARLNHLIEGAGGTGEIGKQVMGSIGRVTSALGTAAGALTSGVMIVVIGIFLAVEPRLYERGLAWMFPVRSRDSFYETMSAMGHTLRRLMAGRLVGMSVEGVGVWLLLWAGGIPMAALLGVLTGLLAFLPNIGAIVSGVLITVVGFSGGWNAGVYAFCVYAVVQTVDGYLVVPTVAKKSVDLAPALVLGAQLLLGALFGLLGLMFADPIVAMVKVGLERGSKKAAENAGEIEAPVA
ncbi:MAG: family transporter [Sphingomonadales bacterium]|nr:family transporter [Sphingomonadales bacterium]